MAYTPEQQALVWRIGERIADEVEKVAHGRQSDCEAAARDIYALAFAQIADLRTVLKLAGDFIEDEADNRGAAGSAMSDYEREPRELLERIDAALVGSKLESSAYAAALKGMVDAYWRGSEDSDDDDAPAAVKAALAILAEAEANG